ncbi:MAG: hypothetical protein WCM93_08555 [Bacteroidota bacterium]
MSDSSNNIKFSYLYRDGGNYKLFGETIFSNPDNLTLTEIESKIKSRLIDGEFFYAKNWSIIPLQFDKYNEELDHGWHEYESVEITDEVATANHTVKELLKIIEK